MSPDGRTVLFSQTTTDGQTGPRALIGGDRSESTPRWSSDGTRIAFLAKRDVQPRIWSTLASGSFDDQNAGAYRFMQYGTGSVPVVQGLAAALDFISGIGIDRIERWDAKLTRRLRDGLAALPHVRLFSPADPGLASALTTFGVAGRPGRELQDALWAKKIRVRAQGTSERVRLSAHLYVAPADIDRVIEVVASFGRARR